MNESLAMFTLMDSFMDLPQEVASRVTTILKSEGVIHVSFMKISLFKVAHSNKPLP